jgi:hypothetical protein
MAVVSLSPIVGIDGVLTIKDGAALSLAIPFTNGDFKGAGWNAGITSGRTAMQEVTDFFARGKYIGSRYTKGKILEFSFTSHMTALLGETGDPTLMDAVLRKGDWAAPSSTVPAARGDVMHYTLEWAVERTDFGATNDRKVTMKYCEVTLDPAEGDDGSTWTVNVRAKPYSTDSITFS